MLGRLNHVAIAVPDLAAASAVYAKTLEAEVSTPVDLYDHGVRVVFVHLPNTKIELLEPLGDDSPIARFLEKNPAGGMHHLCYEVADIIAARNHLLAQGHASWEMGSLRLVRTAGRYCFCTLRTSAVRLLSWSRSEIFC